MKSMIETDVGGKRLELSRLEKIFYPRTGFTKGDTIEYYTRISPAFLPHLKNRPLTLKRYPNGAQGMFFYEKNCPSYRPKWLRTATVWSEGNQRDMDYCLANDLPSLVWAANLACLEFHTSLSVAKDVFRPTMIAFDLDPGAPADIIDCCQVGVWLKQIFDDLKLQSFPKTSGSKGLQIYVPLNTAVTYDQTKPFALALAQILEQQHPERVTSIMKKSLRTGKVFVDWSQNDDHKTTVCVYSLRAKERPTVSAPVTWDEIFAALKHKEPARMEFESADALRRFERFGDLFEPVLKLKQKLPRL